MGTLQAWEEHLTAGVGVGTGYGDGRPNTWPEGPLEVHTIHLPFG